MIKALVTSTTLLPLVACVSFVGASDRKRDIETSGEAPIWVAEAISAEWAKENPSLHSLDIPNKFKIGQFVDIATEAGEFSLYPVLLEDKGAPSGTGTCLVAEIDPTNNVSFILAKDNEPGWCISYIRYPPIAIDLTHDGISDAVFTGSFFGPNGPYESMKVFLYSNNGFCFSKTASSYMQSASGTTPEQIRQSFVELSGAEDVHDFQCD